MFVTQHFASRWKKEWIPLATQQLRLRNLIQILAFSIENEKRNTLGLKENDSEVNYYSKNGSYYFTLHSTIMSAPFYTSEKLKSDCPKWKELQMSSWKEEICSSVDAFVVRLWFSNSKEPTDKALAVWGVYLSGLTYLGTKLRADIPLKPNSLVFLMPGGYFTDPKCIESCVNIRYTSVIVNQCDVRSSYSVNALTRLQALQQVIRKEVEEAELLKKKISIGDFFKSENRGRTSIRKLLSKHKPKTHYADLMKIKENIEIAKYRVTILKEEKNILLQRLKELNKQINSYSDTNQSEQSKILENYKILRKEVHSHKEWKKSYIDRREKYLHSKALLSFRTKQLISELNLIYPIEEVSPNKYTICGVHLPNSESFAGHNELHISIALGFVTHVIQMISVFLQIPLRYPVIHFGSRSRIIDQISDKIPDSEREFCLYVKGRDRLQFHYAIYLLNKNIAQMRWLCGLPTSDLRNTLENLSSLVKVKFGNSNLYQNSRSPSSSTVDLCSSTISISSPLGSAMPVQAKKSSRIHHLSESGLESYTKGSSLSPQPPGHRISKSVGSSKDLMFNVFSIKKKHLPDEKNVNNSLSFSLDKGLDEYEEVSDPNNEQFGSEPTLNSSVKIPKTYQSEVKDKFLKNWNAESQEFPFSDDDLEVHIIDFNLKKQNSSSLESSLSKEKAKEYEACNVENTQSHSLSQPSSSFSPSRENIQEVEKTKTEGVKEETHLLKNKESESNIEVQEIDIDDTDIKCDVNSTVLVTDNLLKSVTSRTEALANQTTCFNRFKTKFKSTLESSN